MLKSKWAPQTEEEVPKPTATRTTVPAKEATSAQEASAPPVCFVMQITG